MNNIVYALLLAGLMDWFAFICQRDTQRLFKGEMGPIIGAVLGIVATIGHFIFFDGFCIALFFKSGFSWYHPICIWAIAFLLNLFVLDRIYQALAMTNWAIAALLHFVALIGVPVIACLQLMFLFR